MSTNLFAGFRSSNRVLFIFSSPDENVFDFPVADDADGVHVLVIAVFRSHKERTVLYACNTIISTVRYLRFICISCHYHVTRDLVVVWLGCRTCDKQI